MNFLSLQASNKIFSLPPFPFLSHFYLFSFPFCWRTRVSEVIGIAIELKAITLSAWRLPSLPSPWASNERGNRDLVDSVYFLSYQFRSPTPTSGNDRMDGRTSWAFRIAIKIDPLKEEFIREIRTRESYSSNGISPCIITYFRIRIRFLSKLNWIPNVFDSILSLYRKYRVKTKVEICFFLFLFLIEHVVEYFFFLLRNLKN